MAVEITEHESIIIDALRETVMEMLAEQEVELLRRIRTKLGGEQFYLPKADRNGTPVKGCRQERNALIKDEHFNDGRSIRYLARKYCISKSQVHAVLQSD